MQAAWTIVLPAALLLGAVLSPAPALGSDNDERPAYMIYMDPETGQYTTRDPMQRRPTDYDAQTTGSPPAPGVTPPESSSPRASDGGRTDRSGVIVIIAGAMLLLAAAGWGIRRKRYGRILGGP